MKNDFVKMMKEIKAELQAFEVHENKNMVLKVCLN